MEKKTFTIQDIEDHLKQHPDFEKVSGTYILSMNPLHLSVSKDGIEFQITDSDFEIFIQQIIEAILELSPVKAASAPKEWAPIPGIDREAVLKRYQETPEIYLELIRDDPNIILIHKINDEGKDISWEISS